MKFKIDEHVLNFKDSDLNKYLHDVGLEFGLELSLKDIKTLVKTDPPLLLKAARWGLSDTEVREDFMDTISRYMINEDFIPVPCTDSDRDKFIERVKAAAISKGFKTYTTMKIYKVNRQGTV